MPRDGHAQLSYDEATNRINSAGWEYDAAGNQTRIQIAGGSWQRLEYDAAGRLVRVRDDNGSVLASYTYGATNERLISQEGDVRTYYAWSGSTVITEYTEVGTSTQPIWSKHYVYLGGRLLATIQPSGGGSERVEFHHPDRLGTRLVTNNQDGSYYEQVTLPFGVSLDVESTGASSRRFTSYDRSAVTGLDYAINRHYDPLQGRFTQVDPVGAGAASLADPQSWNMYSYCGNDPVNRRDPDGLFWGKLFKWLGKALQWVAIAALVATAIISAGTLIFGAVAVKTWLTTTTLGKIVGFIASIPTRIGNFIAGVGKTIAGVFSFVEAGGVSATLATRIGYGVLLGGSAAAGAVSNYLQRQGQRRRQRRAETRKRESLGGEFPAQQQAVVRELLDRIKGLFETNADCAALLGDKENALKVLKRTRVLNVNTVNPSYRGPEVGFNRLTNRTTASIAREEMLKPGSRVYAMGGTDGNVYIGDRFLSLDPNTQATVFIHELKHVNGAGAEIDEDLNSEYANIRRACGLP